MYLQAIHTICIQAAAESLLRIYFYDLSHVLAVAMNGEACVVYLSFYFTFICPFRKWKFVKWRAQFSFAALLNNRAVGGGRDFCFDRNDDCRRRTTVGKNT